MGGRIPTGTAINRAPWKGVIGNLESWSGASQGAMQLDLPISCVSHSELHVESPTILMRLPRSDEVVDGVVLVALFPSSLHIAQSSSIATINMLPPASLSQAEGI